MKNYLGLMGFSLYFAMKIEGTLNEILTLNSFFIKYFALKLLHIYITLHNFRAIHINLYLKYILVIWN